MLVQEPMIPPGILSKGADKLSSCSVLQLMGAIHDARCLSHGLLYHYARNGSFSTCGNLQANYLRHALFLCYWVGVIKESGNGERNEKCVKEALYSLLTVSLIGCYITR